MKTNFKNWAASDAGRARTPLRAAAAGNPTAGSGVPALPSAAFSLIEILVTVALLTVIILGLVAMFNQTRRAFTSSFTQVDVLESGRSASDILAREMEQMAPYGISNTVNFYVDAPQLYQSPFYLVTQPLVDPNDIRTNLLQEVFYLTRYNQQWMAVGYKVDTYSNGIGALYRFTTNIYRWQDVSNSLYYFTSTFANYANTNGYSRLIDGVVDFRIHALDTNGVGFGYNKINGSLAQTNLYLNTFTALYLYPPTFPNGTIGTANDYYYRFTSNSVPAYVELELGVLEDRTLARYNALTNAGYNSTSPAWAYLTNHAGAVHLFRQRIPIRNVNPAAYQ